MRIKQLTTVLICAIVFATSCKKDSPSSSTITTASINSSGAIVLPSNISGAMYAINIKETIQGFPAIPTTQSVMAWFNSATQSDSAGTVTCNGYSLYQFVAGVWYQGSGSSIFDVNSNNIVWHASGNSTAGVPAINYTDVAPMPKTFDFTSNVTTGVNLNSSVTINYNALPSNITGIIFSIRGDNGTKSYGVAGNTSTSFTFSSADLKAIGVSGSQVGFLAMPVIVSPVTISSKQFCFVKQFEILKVYDVL